MCTRADSDFARAREVFAHAGGFYAHPRTDLYGVLVEVLLEASEDVPNLFYAAEVGHGVRQRVTVFETQKGR